MEIAEYLTEHGGLETALRFLADMESTLALIAKFPDSGWRCKIYPVTTQGVRTCRVSEQFDAWLIFYRTESASVEILRVIHGARDIEALFDPIPQR